MKILLLSIFAITCSLTAAESIPTKIVCQLQIGGSQEHFTLNDLSMEQISGEWTTTEKIREKSPKAHFGECVTNRKDVFFLQSPPIELVRTCYRKFAEKHHPRSLYFTQLKSIKAFKAADPKCHGHQIIATNQDHSFNMLYPYSSAEIKSNLSRYNFAVVLEGMVYRSKALGKDGIAKVSEELAEANQPALRSIASIHVMGYGGPGGNYNLDEMEEAKKRGIQFLYTYAADPQLTVYMDGTDPSKIIETDPDHGNIYEGVTVERFVPDQAIRQQLGIDKSIAEHRIVAGNTADFLQSIENMIDAPWPLLIHCKGGRHKTGMFALIFEYLAFNEAMAADLFTTVSVPLYKNRFARWLDNKGSFLDVFFGGPLHMDYPLHPAELHYFEHNNAVFREKNLEFVRGIVSGEKLNTEQLKSKWALIKEKFHAKIRIMAPFAIGQY